MNANAFRHFYNYHFAENRKVWEHVASLTFEQFNQPIGYSRGSIREQVVHLLDVEEGKVTYGVGLSSNITRASVRAIFSAVNRLGLKNSIKGLLINFDTVFCG